MSQNLFDLLRANTGDSGRVITAQQVIKWFEAAIGEEALGRLSQVWGDQLPQMIPYFATVCRPANTVFEEIEGIYVACKAAGEPLPRMLIIATERNQTPNEIGAIWSLLQLVERYDLKDNGQAMSPGVHAAITGGVEGRQHLDQYSASEYRARLGFPGAEAWMDPLRFATLDCLAKNTGHQGHTMAGTVRAFCATEPKRPVVVVPVLPLEHGARFLATVLEGLNNLRDWPGISSRVLFAPVLVGAWGDQTHGGLTRLDEAFGDKTDPRWQDLPPDVKAKIGEYTAKMFAETTWQVRGYAGGIPSPGDLHQIARVLGYNFSLGSDT